MRISPLNRYFQPINFKRAILPEEEKDYHQSIEDGKKYLGINNLALIMHGSSFPVTKHDLYIGSPYNNKAKEINSFLKLHGFDSIQLGPPGMIQRDDNSPYISSIYSRNYLFTDMSKLTTDEYAHILNPEDIDAFTNNDYINNSKNTDFKAAFLAYDKLFDNAYHNLTAGVNCDKPEAIKLYQEFKDFKKQNQHLKTDAIFDVLEKENGHDNFEHWNDLDKNLITYLKDNNSPLHAQALNREQEIYANNSKEIDQYLFKQFIVKKQEKDFSLNDRTLNYMSDAIIGFSPRDVWTNQEAFLENYRVGCPYGGEGKPIEYSSWGANQLWDIPFIDPKKLFNNDGTIGIGGKLIQEKFKSLLENYQNIRIDHVLGLVDPWVYDKRNVYIEKDENDKVTNTTGYGANVSMFGKPNAYRIEGYWSESQKNVQREINKYIENMPDIDPDGAYKRVVHDILLPVFYEKGIKPTDAAWENLGCPTDVFNEVCYGDGGKRPYGDNREIIPGMSALKSYQAEQEAKVVPYNTFLIQSHDDPHTGELMTNQFYEGNQSQYDRYGNLINRGCMDANYLVGCLYPDYAEKTDEDKNIKYENTKPYLFNRLKNDTDFRTLVKWQELMRFGKNIQLTFMDFFGLGERYNYSGTDDKRNWKLRLGKDYQKEYYETLERSKHYDGKDDKWWQHIAINMPELLKRAVISKTLNEGRSLDNVRTLVDSLDHWEKVLYEKTEA